MIFLTATAWPVSWSLAELKKPMTRLSINARKLGPTAVPKRVEFFAHQTKPNAPIPTGCKSVYLVKLVNAWACDVKGVAVTASKGGVFSFFLYSYLLVISKVVPKIWARTNSAMVGMEASRQLEGAERKTIDGRSIVLGEKVKKNGGW